MVPPRVPETLLLDGLEHRFPVRVRITGREARLDEGPIERVVQDVANVLAAQVLEQSTLPAHADVVDAVGQTRRG